MEGTISTRSLIQCLREKTEAIYGRAIKDEGLNLGMPSLMFFRGQHLVSSDGLDKKIRRDT
jgi:hypothetical protein